MSANRIIRPEGYRISSSGAAPLDQIHKTSVQLKLILAAGETRPIMAPGWTFYVIASSAELGIRPDTGAENIYSPGTGLDLEPSNAFTQLQIRNLSATDTLFVYIFVGFDSYIDKRLIFPSLLFKEIPVSTHDWVADGVDLDVDVPDLSGTIITDDNGNEWFAVNRVLLYVFNTSTSDGCFIRPEAGNRTLGTVPPEQSGQFGHSGNLRVVSADGAFYVVENYNCVPNPG